MTSKKLETAVPIEIDYTNNKGDTSTRTILPHSLPQLNVRALDVSTLSEDDVLELQKALAEYQQYRATQMATMFSFEDFIDHQSTGTELPEYKWRSFKYDAINIK
jgi:hypothetical protein